MYSLCGHGTCKIIWRFFNFIFRLFSTATYTLSNTPKMADLYHLDYQHVTKSLFFKARKMPILALKVRLTCVVSVVLLRGKTYAFTKKYTTLTNQSAIFCQITVIFLPFQRF